MPSATKVEKVRELTERFRASQAAVFTDFRGLTVTDAGELRAALAGVDARFAVVKNTLVRLAVREAGLEALEPLAEGPTAVAFVSGDPVTAAKRILEAARRFPLLEVKGGYAEGRVLSADEVRALAALESREAMLAKVAGLGKMQLGRTAFMFQALQSRFVSLLDAYRDKLPGAETPTGPEETPSEGEGG